MSERSETIYLITGATRGLGKRLSLVADVASKDPSAIIYAGARDPSGPGASKLKDVADKYPGRVEIVKYVAGDKEGSEALAKKIGEKYGRVDTIIPNAAISDFIGKIHDAPIHHFPEHFAVNVVGTIILFQSFYSLLKASTQPRFIPISSSNGSMELIPMHPLDMAPYGPSKAALNWVARKIHFENEWLICFPLDPGGVNTDMVQRNVAMESTGVIAAQIFAQLDKLTRTPDVAASLLVDIIRASTRDKEGGQFVNVEGKRHPW